MVIRNLRRFTEPQHAHEYPLCSRLISDFEPKEVLYLAALFHDIAKGRGGDHSTLGAVDARRFCRAHGLPARGRRARRVARRAAPDDVVDRAEAGHLRSGRRRGVRRRVGTERRLIALYLLTVADIRGTSPKVWNAWKAKLLEDLFHATRARLAGDGRDVTLADSLAARQREAQRLLRLYAVPEDAERRAVGAARHRLLPAPHRGRDRLARAPSVLAREGTAPVVKARLVARRGRPAGCRLPARPEGPLRADQRLLRPARAVDRRGEDPHDAPRLRARHVHRARSRRRAGRVPRHDPARRVRARAGADGAAAARAAGDRARLSRHLRHFPLTPEVSIFPDDKGTHYILEIVAGDRAGPARARSRTRSRARTSTSSSAKINTLGERAEDVFLIDGARLHDEQAVLRLETALYEQLRI